MKSLNRIAVLGGLTALFAIASAAVILDPSTGTGFVGKGDVQLAYGWSNAQLQRNAAGVSFSTFTTEQQDRVWTCTRILKNGTEQVTERNNTAQVKAKSVVNSVARERNQVTGFNLTGYGAETIISSVEQGPATLTCPGGGEASDLVVGDVVSDTMFFVTHDGTTHQLLYSLPIVP